MRLMAPGVIGSTLSGRGVGVSSASEPSSSAAISVGSDGGALATAGGSGTSSASSSSSLPKEKVGSSGIESSGISGISMSPSSTKKRLPMPPTSSSAPTPRTAVFWTFVRRRSPRRSGIFTLGRGFESGSRSGGSSFRGENAASDQRPFLRSAWLTAGALRRPRPG